LKERRPETFTQEEPSQEPPVEQASICDVFPKKTTNTALYAAVAVNISCFRALVKAEQHIENTSVKRNTTPI